MIGLLLLILYKVSLDLAFFGVILPIYSYETYLDYGELSYNKLLIGYVLLILLWVLINPIMRSSHQVSRLVLMVQLLVIILPMLTLFAQVDRPTIDLAWILYGFMITFFFVFGTPNIKVPFPAQDISFLLVLIGIAIFTYVYGGLIMTGGLLAGYIGYPGQRLLSLLERRQFVQALKFARQWERWPGRNYVQSWMYLGHILIPNMINKLARKSMGRDFSPSWLKTDLLKEAGVCLSETRMRRHAEGKGRRVIEQLGYSLQKRGLPSLLRHADRNSMRFSVESRVPFLTIPFANKLLSLPEEYLVSNSGETKSVFRAAMRGIVPDDVLDRKDKIGFATPEKKWLYEIIPLVTEWLKKSDEIPFINRNALLNEFEMVVAGRSAFSWQVWRWVNFVRWYSHEIGHI